MPTASDAALVMLVISVDRLFKIEMVLPVTGAVLDVILTPVWLLDVAKLLTKLAQLVAVTTPLVLTLLNVVWPQPKLPEPAAQNALVPEANEL